MTYIKASATVFLLWLGSGVAAAQSPEPNAVRRLTLPVTFRPPVVRPAPARSTRAQGGGAPAAASTSWEIEGHAGPKFGSHPGGTTTLPVGDSFLTFSGFQSRFVPSWYFGDGALLFNQHAATVGLPPRIAPLDAALSASSVKAHFGQSTGARASHPVSPRVSLEINVDYMAGGLALTPEARGTIVASQTSFQTGFAALIASLSNRVVTSSATIEDARGGQIVATLALRLSKGNARRFRPYLTAGGGIVRQTGDQPRVTLVGDYRYTSASNTPYRQIDTVTVRYQTGAAAVAVVGAGFTRALAQRSGLRGDVRMHLAQNTTHVILTAKPETIIGVPVNTFAFNGNPAIQISTSGSLSTLSGKLPKNDYTAAVGHGVRTLFNFTLGYYFRF